MNQNIFKLLLAPVIKEEKKKRYAKMPDIGFLKNQQNQGFSLMKSFVDDPMGGMFCLEGYAGTGKTTLISVFTEWMLASKRTIIIAMTAPTNKAVRVQYKAADYTHTNLNYATIHSLLGLKEKINDFGEQVFEKEWGVESKIDETEVLIVDEVSMLSDELFEMVLPYIDKGLKIIFVGDPAQIPPINKKDCIPLSSNMRREYGIGHFRLTEILRQAQDNPIIALTMVLRENVTKPAPMVGHKVTKIDDNGKGVIFFNKKNDDEFCEILERFYRSENFKLDSDFVKVLAYTNKVVDYMNRVIREIIYDDDNLPKIKIGERLIANKAIVWGDELLFSNNEEMEVISFEIDTENINEGQYLLKYYNTEVTKTNNDGSVETKHIKIIHEDSEAEYKSILKQLMQLAQAQPRGSVFSKKYWESYWEFLKYFADINYSYAVTCHKSQGSTYNVAIVLENNINTVSRIEERNRIKYTAFTRPKDLLIVIN